MAEEQTSIRVTKETRARLAAFAVWEESLDHAINRALDFNIYYRLKDIRRRWGYVSFSYRFGFAEGEIIYNISRMKNLFGSVRIVLYRSGTDIKLFLENDPWDRPGVWDDTPPAQSEVTDVPLIARFGDEERKVGTLTLRAASFGDKPTGYPVDLTVNDLIWMDYLLDNYERIIDEFLPPDTSVPSE